MVYKLVVHLYSLCRRKMAASDPLQLDTLYVVWWQIVVSRVSAEVSTILAPHQLGVGVKLATEAAAHASRTYINNLTSGGIEIRFQ